MPVPGRAVAALDIYLRESRPDLARDPWEMALCGPSSGACVATRRRVALLAGGADVQRAGGNEEGPSAREAPTDGPIPDTYCEMGIDVRQ